MRKQELVHLHGLFAQVRRHCEQVDGRSIDCSTYECLDTVESSIHRGKDEHRIALFALAGAISEELQTPDERKAVSATTRGGTHVE